MQSLNGAHASGHAAIAMRGGGSGPERSLRARKVYSDPIEPEPRSDRPTVTSDRSPTEPDRARQSDSSPTATPTARQ